jgi:hypothetical protein
MGERYFQLTRTMFIAAGSPWQTSFVMFFLPESHQPGARPKRNEPLFPHLLDHVERRTYAWSIASYFLVIVGFSMMTAIFALLLCIASALIGCTRVTFWRASVFLA